MTERELFRQFYAVARVNKRDGHGAGVFSCSPLAQEGKAQAFTAARASGLDIFAVVAVEEAANTAVSSKCKQNSLPSRNSVRIQMLVFTFGRVRRDV
ncbi:MAG: hypothetical protein H9917_05000 [Candidatus Oceanisphaera merdipullorum]|nr:hypothetical protein [Candidatus Oceanisphaera merdipullorum]